MPGVRCSVSCCNNSKVKFPNLIFHRFPCDQEIKKEWIQRCNRDGKWNPDCCRICSVHFTEKDYERDLRSELLNLQALPKLKPTAVPSLLLNEIINKPSKLSSSRCNQFAKRKNHNIAEDLLALSEASLTLFEEPTANRVVFENSKNISSEDDVTEPSTSKIIENTPSSEPLEISPLVKSCSHEEIRSLKDELNQLKVANQNIKFENVRLKNRVNQLNKSLKRKTKVLSKSQKEFVKMEKINISLLKQNINFINKIDILLSSSRKKRL